MATTRILYDTSTQLGKQVAFAVNNLLKCEAEMSRVKKILDSAQYGDDYPALAAELGLPATEAGADAAEALWAIFSNARDRVVHAAVDECARLDQG